jgi:RND family efflux transporter MFP subunit
VAAFLPINEPLEFGNVPYFMYVTAVNFQTNLMPAEQFDLSKLTIQRNEDPPSDSFKRPRYWLLVYVAGGLFLLAAAFFFIKNSLDPGELIEVSTVSLLSPSQAGSLLTASGYVVAQRKASIASKATGRLVYLGFKEGDRVRKGEIIARIESADMEAALAQVRADLAVARADSIDAAQTLTRTRQLLDRQLASQADFDAAKARADRVQATIASREASVVGADVQLENTNIRAPFDGTILTKNADIGEVVAPFAAGGSSRVAVVTIADMTSLEVEADVSESNLERINAHQPCTITLDAYPDKAYRGVVDKIVPTADRAKATVMTKIRFLEIDSRVIPEMGAKVQFLNTAPDTGDTRPRIVLDTACVVTRDSRPVVFVVKNESVTETPVTLGRSYASVVEVTSPLTPGEKAVLRPTEKMYSGIKVHIKK